MSAFRCDLKTTKVPSSIRIGGPDHKAAFGVCCPAVLILQLPVKEVAASRQEAAADRDAVIHDWRYAPAL